MRTSTEGLDLIRSFESCSLTAYQDQGGRWTLGWGRARGIKSGDVCTQEQADEWFAQDILGMEEIVFGCVPSWALNENRLSALVSFVYNVGPGVEGKRNGFRVLKAGGPSTMLMCLLMGDYQGAADEFPKWVRIGGCVSLGLQRRRLAERALFLAPVDKGVTDGKD